MLVLYHSSQFAMSHGSYDSNLGSEILNLVKDILCSKFILGAFVCAYISVA